MQQTPPIDCPPGSASDSPFDCRAEIFRQRGFEVLSSVVQGTLMAQPDPWDVEQVHAEARAAFHATLDQVRKGPASKILLIRGEAGCGKTHLIRALRAKTHADRHGVIAYVHMTSEHGDYRQYLLRQVVRSLSDAYVYQPSLTQQSSALDLISDALVAAGDLERDEVERLRETDDDETLAELVSNYADELSEVGDAGGRTRFAEVDLNTLRILLYRQSTRKPIQRRVASFLNGDPLSDVDWRKLAAMPHGCDRGPMHLLMQLARATTATLGSPLIVCVDQIEASDITGKNHEPFLRAMSSACELIENVPGSMVLLSCLNSAYQAHAPNLIEAYRDRIEHDPPSVLLRSARSESEIRLMISRRVKWLYESEGMEHHPPDSVFPMPEAVPQLLQRNPMRAILQQCHRYWALYRQAPAGAEVAWPAVDDGEVTPPPDPEVDRLRIEWNEYRTAGEHHVGEDDEVQIELFAWALGALRDELDESSTVQVERCQPPAGQPPAYCLAVTVNLPRTPPLARLVGLCDKDPRGGGLYNQLTALERLRAEGQVMVVLRSTHFPRAGRANEQIKHLKDAGHLLAVVDDPTWQTMQAMRSFLASRGSTYPAGVVREWRRTDQPLAGLPGIASVLQVDRSPGAAAPATNPPVNSTGGTAPKPDGGTRPEKKPPPPKPDRRKPKAADPLPPFATGAMVIGRTDGFAPADVTLDPQVLTRHSAILGAAGSGKTVLALTIVEMLLERGVSVVLFDRKGDLASYAADRAWAEKTGAPDEASRRAALRARTDVHLYTPGSAAGRPLVLPLLPAGLAKLTREDRQEEARRAAMILCDVCAPTGAKSDMFVTVLARAVELLCDSEDPRSLDDLEGLLLQAPQELLARLPAHTEKHCEDVGRRLNERRTAHGRLFSDQGERLDLRAMLRGGADGAGRVRLNVISTQFLDGDAGLIWIAQFLAAAGRYILRHPSPTLQALLMFDEADQYVPAVGKPASKPGMENLIKRARAAGVGVMLATQSVGDFDYKALDNITTAFAGKMSAQRALEKLQPRLGDAVGRLPKKSLGQFVMAQEAQVREIKTHMCLVRPTVVPRDEIERLAAAQREAAAAVT